MDGNSNKRAANGQHTEDEPDHKKAKVDAGPAKPALNLEALQKAKLLLEKQKALREKLKKVPALTAGATAAAAAAAQPSAAALAASAHPLAPGGTVAGVNAAEVAAKAAKAVEIASKFGVQASLAGVPALAAATAASGMAPAGIRPLLNPAAAAAAAAPGVGVRPPAAAGPGPRILRLDAAGREVDEAGNVIQAVRVPVASSLINMPRPEPAREPSPPPGPKDEDFIDTTMAVRSGPGRGRSRGGAFLNTGRGRGKKAALEFVEEGSLQRQAEIMRLKQKYGEAEFRKHLPPHLRRPPRGPAGPAERQQPDAAAAAAAGAADTLLPPPPGGPDGDISGANLVPLGVRQVEESEEDKLRKKLPEVAADPPLVEWWDKPLLEGGAYYTQPTQQQPAAAAAGQEGGGGPETAQQQQQDGDAADAAAEQQQQQLGGDAMQEDGGGSGGGQEQQQQQHKKASKQHAVQVLGVSDDGQQLEMRLRLGRLTRYVEHPVPLEPPDEGPPPAPQPLKLTKRELKKLRTQRRQAREKEKQELMRQGLLEPPKPKVKISNLMRVLGEEAVLDPTAIEQEVRRQMSERQAAHDDRNLARALTPAERRDKKLRKLFEGGGGGAMGGNTAGVGGSGSNSTLAAVYRVESLAHGQHRFKVDVNAKENHMSGIMLVCPSAFSLVVVEGVPKALKRYHKLMLRRINWAEVPAAAAAGAAAGGDEGQGEAAAAAAAEADDDDDDDDAEGRDKPANSCHLVWEGIVASNSFRDFVKEEVQTAEAARKLLEERGVAHYWDTAANYDFDAAPLPSAVFS